MRSFKICLIAGVDSNNFGIGFMNELMYECKRDLTLFKVITTKTIDKNKKNAILMGRKTYLSLSEKFPLSDRINIILSKSYSRNETLNVFSSFEEVEKYCEDLGYIETLFIIGGESLYKHYIKTGNYDTIHITFFTSDIGRPTDTFFPRFNTDYHKITEDEAIITYDKRYNEQVIMKHVCYEKITNIEEYEYLKLIRDIYYNGEIKQTRNSITKSVFGRNLTFDLRNSKFPLLTTKKTFFKGIAKELLWFLKGNTNAKDLQKDGIHIWDSNSTREFLDKQNLNHLEEGDCGAIYSHQWRRFGAEYKDCNYDYTNSNGFDQIEYCINEIKTNPSSRRIVLSGWNPQQLNQCCLPCCHILYIFNVTNSYLSCQMTMRSSDTFLGLPFNIASTALLVYLLAHYCDLKPGKITLCLADCHIYADHFEAIDKQLKRMPYEFPTFEILGDKPLKIEDYTYEQFKISNYKCHSMIKAPMIA